jgi:hypothetical protein
MVQGRSRRIEPSAGQSVGILFVQRSIAVAICHSPRGNRHHLARNVEAEFNEAGILPKMRDAAIMATTVYIASNAPNDDEHVLKLRALALKGVWVLQTANEPPHNPTARRSTGAAHTSAKSAFSRV